MGDRPIIFSASMIAALLAGRKTQTRRGLTRVSGRGAVTEFGPSDTAGYDWHFRDKAMRWHDLRDADLKARLPWQVGDRLWVREAWRAPYELDYFDEALGRPLRPVEFDPAATAIEYLADGERELGGKDRSSLHLPRWASRLTLLVTDVRVERLQDISEGDAQAEGIEPEAEQVEGTTYFRNYEAARGSHLPPRASFSSLWNSINGTDAWAANPWICAVSFRCIQQNIDQLAPTDAHDIAGAA